MIWVDLIYNLALLVALSVVSGFVDTRWKRTTRLGALLQGVVFGGAAVIGMLRPFVYAPGLIFDGRSVMISLGGLFFGPWTMVVACLITIPLRLAQGGPGMVMGVLVILASAGLGIGFHRRRLGRSGEMSAIALLEFGVLVHLTMLAMTAALPPTMILPVLKRIAWPVLLTYPLATVLIGKILSDQAARGRFLEELRTSEQRFQAIFNSAFQFTGLLTPAGLLTEANKAILDFGGLRREEVIGQPFWQARWWRGNEARVRQLQEAIRRAAAGDFVRYEVDLQGAGQTTATVDFSLKPVFDPAHRVVLLIPEARDITARKLAEETLRTSLEEKEALLKEVHHRVKNNLQIISSLLNLQAQKVGNAEARVFLRETQNRIRAMALLHETLYGSESLARVNFRRYAESLCAHLGRTYASPAHSVRLRPEIAEVTLPPDQAIPAGLIINELVSNAFKHAFVNRAEGEITVQLRTSDEHSYTLRVTDNGVGLPATTDPQAPTTLGLRLVDTLARQLDGTLTTRLDSGTVFEIVFPIQPQA